MSVAFRIDIDGALPGAENMRRDAALVEDVRSGTTGVVRLYAWSPYAASLGYNQDAASIDAELCRDLGIDVVRRPTGGRAVLHAEEITYAVITPLAGTSPQDWYAAIHSVIAQGLAEVGLNDTAFVKSQPHFAERYRQASGALCFSSSARYELEWNGRKFVGSAQRVLGGVLLQHGSILLGPYHATLGQLLNVDAERRNAMSRLLRERAISIGEILGRPITFEECCGPLAAAFADLGDRVESMQTHSSLSSITS